MYYSIYSIPEYSDDQTGETWEGEPYSLRLTYDDRATAEAAAEMLRRVPGMGKIEIDVRGMTNTYQPGESE